MLTAIGVIIGIIWVIVEESKKKPSNLYLAFKEFSCSPEGQEFARNYQSDRNNKRIAKAQKKQRKRQNRQTRNLIIAHHCVKKYNNFVFENNKMRKWRF